MLVAFPRRTSCNLRWAVSCCCIIGVFNSVKQLTRMYLTLPVVVPQDYKKLGILKQQFPQVPILALTATATHQVSRWVCGQGARPGWLALCRCTLKPLSHLLHQ